MAEGDDGVTNVVDLILELRLKTENLSTEEDTEYMKNEIDQLLKEIVK